MDFSVTLIPPEFATPPKAAKRAWRAHTTDNRTLQVIEWGNGTQADPLAFLVRVSVIESLTPDGAADVSWRSPHLDELEAAIDALSPAGAVFSLGYYQSEGPDGEPVTLPPGTKWIGAELAQVNVAAHSPAARRSDILHLGGNN